MKKVISAQRASKILVWILGLMIVFHLLVILKIVPATWVWGNKIPPESVLPLELIAIVITFSFGLFLQIKMRYVKMEQRNIAVNVVLWIIAAFLTFNAIANVISEVTVENVIFAPLALLMAILTIRLAIE